MNNDTTNMGGGPAADSVAQTPVAQTPAVTTDMSMGGGAPVVSTPEPQVPAEPTMAPSTPVATPVAGEAPTMESQDTGTGASGTSTGM